MGRTKPTNDKNEKTNRIDRNINEQEQEKQNQLVKDIQCEWLERKWIFLFAGLSLDLSICNSNLLSFFFDYLNTLLPVMKTE